MLPVHMSQKISVSLFWHLQNHNVTIVQVSVADGRQPLVMDNGMVCKTNPIGFNRFSQQQIWQ